jgi:hypothetical protein
MFPITIGTMVNKISVPTTRAAAILGAVGAAMMMVIMLMTPMLLQVAFAAPTLQGPIRCEIVGDNQLRCLADVSGLGGAKSATATLVTTATVTTGCITSSGSNEPRGLQKTAVTVSDTQTVNVESGKATLNLITQPLDAEEIRTCPNGLTPTIVCVTFSNISIAVIPNSGPSRTFTTDQAVSNC